MDQRADAGDDEEHGLAELIDGESNGDRELRRYVEPMVLGGGHAVVFEEEDAGGEERDEAGGNRDHRAEIALPLREQRDEHRAQKRSQKDDPG